MAINKQHSDYSEYIEKCEILSQRYFAREEELEMKSQQGETGPSVRKEIRGLLKEYSIELKKLQEKYAHLFIIE